MTLVVHCVGSLGLVICGQRCCWLGLYLVGSPGISASLSLAGGMSPVVVAVGSIEHGDVVDPICARWFHRVVCGRPASVSVSALSFVTMLLLLCSSCQQVGRPMPAVLPTDVVGGP